MADPRREKLEIILEEMLKDTWRTPYMRSFADRIEAFYAPAIDSDAELRGKLKELFAGEPFYEMSTDEVIDHILMLIRPHPKPSPEDLAISEQGWQEIIGAFEIQVRLQQPELQPLLEKLKRLAAWGVKGGE